MGPDSSDLVSLFENEPLGSRQLVGSFSHDTAKEGFSESSRGSEQPVKSDGLQTAGSRTTDHPALLPAPLARHLFFQSVLFPSHSRAAWPDARALSCLAQTNLPTPSAQTQGGQGWGRLRSKQVQKPANSLASCRHCLMQNQHQTTRWGPALTHLVDTCPTSAAHLYQLCYRETMSGHSHVYPTAKCGFHVNHPG